MLEGISIHKRNNGPGRLFSIAIPSWNNLAYLRLCVESIRKNSCFKHQIIVIVNEGSDGTADWVAGEPDIDYVYSSANIGICYGLNACRKLVATDYLLYANDDMYFLPAWDKPLVEEIKKIGHKGFMLSSTMVEPSGDNPAAVRADYGSDLSAFREEKLLEEHTRLFRADWSGSTWPPNVVHIDCWDLVGGMSVEYSPGMYSDPDLSRKLWEAGVRIFKGKGNSLVYHFGSKSTERVRKNKGRKTFTLKWGVSARTFMKQHLNVGGDAVETLPEQEPSQPERLYQLAKRIKSCF